MRCPAQVATSTTHATPWWGPSVNRPLQAFAFSLQYKMAATGQMAGMNTMRAAMRLGARGFGGLVVSRPADLNQFSRRFK